jgi:hypothetical protein
VVSRASAITTRNPRGCVVVVGTFVVDRRVLVGRESARARTVVRLLFEDLVLEQLEGLPMCTWRPPSSELRCESYYRKQ